MKKHDPVKLTQAERMDIASITKHPGMAAVIDRILGQHYDQQMAMIHTVQIDDADRIVKISAICAVADAMKLNIECLKQELQLNWEILAKQEYDRNEKGAKQ